jgi:nitrogen fixation NifU-like protein
MTKQEESDRWDLVIAELQREIDEKERALYSAKVLQQARNPEHLARMEAPDAHATLTGWCGDTMEIHLRLNGAAIQAATFMTDGCGPSLACGNMLSTMVEGLALDDASEIKPGDLVLALDGLPEESLHCAQLAVDTLHQAIANLDRKNEIDTA